jgi:hypothetical protein
MYPPIRRARENDGELRKPTANAIPEGKYRIDLPIGVDGEMVDGKALRPERRAKKVPKAIMKGTT